MSSRKGFTSTWSFGIKTSMIRSFKCTQGDEYVLSSVSSEGAKTASTSLTKSTSLTMCRDFVAWNIGETLYISLSASIGKVS